MWFLIAHDCVTNHARDPECTACMWSCETCNNTALVGSHYFAPSSRNRIRKRHWHYCSPCDRKRAPVFSCIFCSWREVVCAFAWEQKHPESLCNQCANAYNYSARTNVCEALWTAPLHQWVHEWKTSQFIHRGQNMIARAHIFALPVSVVVWWNHAAQVIHLWSLVRWCDCEKVKKTGVVIHTTLSPSSPVIRSWLSTIRKIWP